MVAPQTLYYVNFKEIITVKRSFAHLVGEICTHMEMQRFKNRESTIPPL